MFKRILCFAVLFCLLFTAFSCAPSPSKQFRKTAEDYFAEFETLQMAGKQKKEIKYSKEGSVAVTYPKMGEDSFDSEIKAHCDGVVSDFKAKATSDKDTLFISYESYCPAKGVYGVQMNCKMTLGGNTLETAETFNFGIKMNENFEKLLTIEARDTLKNPDKKQLIRTLIMTDGIRAVYRTDEGDLTAQVPYDKLRQFIPETIKTEDSGRYIDITKKMVALTFDDGPHNTYTNRILDTLEENDSVATFFEVGNLVSQGADTVKRAKDMGCEIGSHTWSHGNLQTLSLENIKSQIDKADRALMEVTGEKPTLLRPPYGAVGKTLRENTDKYLIGWSVDTNDWKYRDKDKIIESVKNAGNLDGDVVLMHSLYESTAEAVEELVPWLIENGYQLVTVSELVKYRYEDTLEGGKYYAYNYFDYGK